MESSIIVSMACVCVCGEGICAKLYACLTASVSVIGLKGKTTS